MKKKIILPLPALIGAHQIENAGAAIAAVLVQKHFKITEENIARGLENAKWKARLEKITQGKFATLLPADFSLFLDGGHNEGGAKTIAKWLKNHSEFDNYLICGMLENKDTEGFLKQLAEYVELVIGIKIKDEPKSKSARQICDLATKIGIRSMTGNNFFDAIQKVINFHNSKKNAYLHNLKPARILICGSLYLAGEFIEENDLKK